jgi:hypothetical protein
MDPLPLTQNGATPFEALLLSAGRADALSSEGRVRIHLGLGLGGGMLAAAAMVSVKANAVKSALSLGSAAWIGGVGAVAMFFGARAFLDVPTTEVAPPSQPASLHELRTTAPVAPVHVSAPDPAPAVIDVNQPKPAEMKTTPRALPGASLVMELRAIEEARRALTRQEHALALRSLDEYEKSFPQPRLRSEATLLRIETLAASGATHAAQQLGTSFLAKHPNGPYARRVRSLLSDAAPTVRER